MKISLSLFAKLFLTFSILTSASLTLTGYVTYRNMAATLNNNLDKETNAYLDQKMKALTIFVNDIDRMGSSISQSPAVSDFLKNTDQDVYFSSFRQLDGLVERIHAIRPENIGITIVSDNGFTYNFGYTLSDRQIPFQQFPWLPPSHSYMDKPFLTPLHDRPYVAVKELQPVFSFVLQLTSNNLKEHGLLIIDFPMEVLNDFFETSPSSAELSGVFVTDQNGAIVHPVSQPFITAKDLTDMNGTSRMVKNDTFYKVIHKRDSATGWTLGAYFMEDQLYASIDQFRNSTIVTIIQTILLCLIASFFISRSIASPIQKLKRLMKQFGSGDLDQYFEIQRKDEIGALGVGFNGMVKRIKELIQLVYYEQNEKRKAEVAALQSQINPHFLYNTLESINSLARKHKEPEISKMIVMLGKLLRMSISTHDDLVRIESELEYVQYYLEIHKFRLQRPIDYEITMDDEMRQLYTVKWILQPIIENAIIHGLDRKQHGGSIKITGWSDGEDIFIQVADQGVGVAYEQLQQMRHHLQHDSDHMTKQEKKVGLYNVQSRIQLHFGKNYGIYLDSVLHEGMKVTVKIPRRTTNESL
ncbi:cache domain-containing sensor histidine kinase [Paenibacillus pasadenensis]|uniref:cache domain-containing sensor histidine kinase n=1 Tax=Paenibacillus pasadenensis TaxID=217090 RepID=UPI00203AC7D6|nr:sensor histidine kinase [Paenibacillus pasadenensis]